MRVFFGSIFGLILAYVAYVIAHTGFFKEVEIEHIKSGPEFHLVYKVHIGPYHKVVNTLEKVEKWAEERNINCRTTFGHYLDDPETVDEDRLQSHAGCVVNSKVSDLPEDFFYKNIPEREYVKGTFEGSPALSAIRVYPKMYEFFKEKLLQHDGLILETYTKTGENGLISTYYMPAKN